MASIMKRHENPPPKISDIYTQSLKVIQKTTKKQLPFKISVDTCKRDAEQLFASSSSASKTIQLRSAKDLTTGNKCIKLPSFDPNFMMAQQIPCRFPGCTQSKIRESLKKEDLYVCPTHRDHLVKEIQSKLTKAGLSVDLEAFRGNNNDDLNKYTSLIGLMELGFMDCKEMVSRNPTRGKKARLLAEIFLNSRNFLLITNAVLNPDINNLHTALNPVLTILMEILRQIDAQRLADQVVEALCNLLRNVMNVIANFFGFVYEFVKLAVFSSGEAKVGAGIGGIGLFIGAAIAFGGPVGAVVGAVVGIVCGGLVGGGYHQFVQQRNDLPWYYEFRGDAHGNFGIQLQINNGHI